MKQIAYFYLPGIKGLHLSLNFFSNIYDCIKQIEDPHFQPVLKSYHAAMSIYTKATRPPSNNLLTMQIATEDECRDNFLQAIHEKKDELLAANNEPDRETGQQIDAILNAHGDITAMEANEKTKQIISLSIRLDEEVGSLDLTRTGMADYIAELNRANWSFSELSKARNDEMEGKILTTAIMNARREMDKTYQETVVFINAMLIYNGDNDYADIIDQVNLLVEEAARPTMSYR
ncbi:MAG: DUF6261 family protein [Tannerellaceae bacterium]|nr:DUF6261 family protein [Tannerellaceae bacterium]